MLARLMRILSLGVKELYSLRSDPVMAILIVYTFTIAVYTVSTGAKFEVRNASVAVVDEDGSMLSLRLRDALLNPFFQQPRMIPPAEIDRAMNAGRYVFVLEIPPHFQADLLSGRRPALQLDIDATAMSQAGNGAAYIQSIVTQEVEAWLPRTSKRPRVEFIVTSEFNPNLMSAWFTAVMQVINNVTILSVILTGAALIREREHGTIEHLLVMPVTPIEIMLSKIWANGLVILTAALLCLVIVVRHLLQVPIRGSTGLFILSAALYQFSITSLGILIATFSTSMAQFALVAMPILITMNLLSGSTTPMEAMPLWLQYAMQASPSAHFVSLSQAVLYRSAGLSIIWPQLGALLIIGLAFFAASLWRFRQTVSQSQ